MVDLNTVVTNIYNYLILAYITAQMVKECLLILRKTSPTNASSASPSDDDFAEDETSVASSPKAEGAEKAEAAETAEV